MFVARCLLHRWPIHSVIANAAVAIQLQYRQLPVNVEQKYKSPCMIKSRKGFWFYWSWFGEWWLHHATHAAHTSHAAHTTGTGTSHWVRRVLFWFFCNHGFGGQHQ
jgi:hypothetical protein